MTPAERFELAKSFVTMQDQDGLSSSIIAIRYHLTRNTVCGMIHRAHIKLGMRRPTARKPSVTLRKARQDPSIAPLVASIRPARHYKPKQPKAVPEAPKPIGGAFHIAELGEGQCRFPTKSTSVTHFFCGAPTAIGKSWCPSHELRVYQPLATRPKQAQDEPPAPLPAR